MNSPLRRHASTGLIMLGSALAAVTAHQLVTPWHTRVDDHSYFLSHLLVDNYLAWTTQAVLVAVGFFLGYTRGASILVVALATMLPFPLATLFEIIKDSTSHNLLPFELVIWVPLAAPATIATVVGRIVRRRRT